MIQAVNSVNTNSYKKNPNFGEKREVILVDYSPEYIQQQMQPKKKSKAGLFAKFVAREALMGAGVSLAIDGLANAWHAIKKQPDSMMKATDMLKRAGFWGVAWVAMGIVIAGVSNMFKKD